MTNQACDRHKFGDTCLVLKLSRERIGMYGWMGVMDCPKDVDFFVHARCWMVFSSFLYLASINSVISTATTVAPKELSFSSLVINIFIILGLNISASDTREDIFHII